MFGRFLLRTWQHRGWAAQLLRPVAALYGAVLRQRAQSFSLSALSQRPPIIVVGNVVVGGVGKTPILMALVQHLQSLGYRPGVISRGYGRQSASGTIMEVLSSTSAAQAGDEPLLIAQATKAPVFVGANRPAALAALCAAHPEVNIVLSDDGLQHWALPRDIEIVVWDGRGRGNGYLLPAGMLREPWPRRAWHPWGGKTQLLHVYSASAASPLHPDFLPADASWPVARHLANFALRADGRRISLVDLHEQALQGQTVHAVAGIAQPENFFADLRAQGVALAQTVALPDHADIVAWWQGLSPQEQTGCWLCTQKDAVKLWAVCPQALAVPLELELPPGFLGALAAALVGNGTTKIRAA